MNWFQVILQFNFGFLVRWNEILSNDVKNVGYLQSHWLKWCYLGPEMKYIEINLQIFTKTIQPNWESNWRWIKKKKKPTVMKCIVTQGDWVPIVYHWLFLFIASVECPPVKYTDCFVWNASFSFRVRTFLHQIVIG